MLLTFVSYSVCFVSGHWLVLCNTRFLEIHLETESILDHFTVLERASAHVEYPTLVFGPHTTQACVTACVFRMWKLGSGGLSERGQGHADL